MPQHEEHCASYHPRGAFKFINFLAQLLIVVQESLPNPCGWNKSGKLRKLNYNLPAVDQNRRQTTWIEVHQRFLKPEASTSMKRPQSLLVIVPAFQNFFDRSPWKWTSWRARTLPKLHFHCPNKASSWYWTNSFLDHCHQQSTPKLLGFTSKDPLGRSSSSQHQKS